jgi:hypothetical protein
LWLVLSWICAGRAGEAATLHRGGIVLWEALEWTAVLDWWKQPKKDRFRYGVLFSPLEGEGFPAAELDLFRALADAAATGALNEKPRHSKTRLYPLFPRFFGLGAAALASITTGTFRRLAVAGTVPGLKASHTATGLRAGARSWLLNNGVPDNKSVYNLGHEDAPGGGGGGGGGRRRADGSHNEYARPDPCLVATGASFLCNGPLQEGASKTPHRSPSTDAPLDACACDAAALEELMDAFLQSSADRTPHLARASRGGNGTLCVLVHTMFASKLLRHFEHDCVISAAPPHVPVVARLIQAIVSFKIAPDAAAAVTSKERQLPALAADAGLHCLSWRIEYDCHRGIALSSAIKECYGSVRLAGCTVELCRSTFLPRRTWAAGRH